VKQSIEINKLFSKSKQSGTMQILNTRKTSNTVMIAKPDFKNIFKHTFQKYQKNTPLNNIKIPYNSVLKESSTQYDSPLINLSQSNNGFLLKEKSDGNVIIRQKSFSKYHTLVNNNNQPDVKINNNKNIETLQNFDKNSKISLAHLSDENPENYKLYNIQFQLSNNIHEPKVNHKNNNHQKLIIQGSKNITHGKFLQEKSEPHNNNIDNSSHIRDVLLKTIGDSPHTLKSDKNTFINFKNLPLNNEIKEPANSSNKTIFNVKNKQFDKSTIPIKNTQKPEIKPDEKSVSLKSDKNHFQPPDKNNKTNKNVILKNPDSYKHNHENKNHLLHTVSNNVNVEKAKNLVQLKNPDISEKINPSVLNKTNGKINSVPNILVKIDSGTKNNTNNTAKNSITTTHEYKSIQDNGQDNAIRTNNQIKEKILESPRQIINEISREKTYSNKTTTKVGAEKIKNNPVSNYKVKTNFHSQIKQQQNSNGSSSTNTKIPVMKGQENLINRTNLEIPKFFNSSNNIKNQIMQNSGDTIFVEKNSIKTPLIIKNSKNDQKNLKPIINEHSSLHKNNKPQDISVNNKNGAHHTKSIKINTLKNDENFKNISKQEKTYSTPKLNHSIYDKSEKIISGIKSKIIVKDLNSNSETNIKIKDLTLIKSTQNAESNKQNLFKTNINQRPVNNNPALKTTNNLAANKKLPDISVNKKLSDTKSFSQTIVQDKNNVNLNMKNIKNSTKILNTEKQKSTHNLNLNKTNIHFDQDKKTSLVNEFKKSQVSGTLKDNTKNVTLKADKGYRTNKNINNVPKHTDHFTSNKNVNNLNDITTPNFEKEKIHKFTDQQIKTANKNLSPTNKKVGIFKNDNITPDNLKQNNINQTTLKEKLVTLENDKNSKKNISGIKTIKSKSLNDASSQKNASEKGIKEIQTNKNSSKKTTKFANNVLDNTKNALSKIKDSTVVLHKIDNKLVNMQPTLEKNISKKSVENFNGARKKLSNDNLQSKTKTPDDFKVLKSTVQQPPEPVKLNKLNTKIVNQKTITQNANIRNKSTIINNQVQNKHHIPKNIIPEIQQNHTKDSRQSILSSNIKEVQRDATTKNFPEIHNQFKDDGNAVKSNEPQITNSSFATKNNLAKPITKENAKDEFVQDLTKIKNNLTSIKHNKHSSQPQIVQSTDVKVPTMNEPSDKNFIEQTINDEKFLISTKSNFNQNKHNPDLSNFKNSETEKHSTTNFISSNQQIFGSHLENPVLINQIQNQLTTLKPVELNDLSSKIHESIISFTNQKNEEKLVLNTKIADLGNFKIELSQKDGNIDVILRVQSENTQKILEQALPELRHNLAKSEVPVNDIRIIFMDSNERQYLAKEREFGKSNRETKKRKKLENLKLNSDPVKNSSKYISQWSTYEAIA